MKRSRSLTLVLAAAMLAAAALACDTVDSLWCEFGGGKWIPAYMDKDTGLVEQPAYCDKNPSQEIESEEGTGAEPDSADQSTGDLPLSECIVTDQADNWDYENLTGEAGNFCNAEFVYHNSSNQKVSLIVLETWDTNAQSGSKWKSLILDPGQLWTKRSSYAWRPDDPQGDTYNYISRSLVVYNSPGCSWLTYDQESLWEEVGLETLAPCH